MRVREVVLIAVGMLWSGSAWSASSVTVESKQMGAGAVDCPIYIQLVNDVTLSGFALPMEARAITPGVFMTAARMAWRERLHSAATLGMIRLSTRYAERSSNCGPNGYAPPYASNDTLKHTVISSPEGFMFAALSESPEQNLLPGSDIVGSLAIYIDLGPTTGTFQIDTTCIDPGSHLDFVDDMTLEIIPTFSFGTITVVDNAPPVAACQNVTVPAGEDCTAPALIDAGSFDPDGGSVTIVQTPGGPYLLGETSVQIVVTDQSCTSDSCSAMVTVVDVTPPVAQCPSDTAILVPFGTPGTNVVYATSATDNCPGVAQVCTPPSGSQFPVGLTTVVCIATDASGNADTCQFQVLVSPDVACNDHPNDTNCDGHIDILDVVLAIEVAFRGREESGPCCFSPSTGARIELSRHSK